MARSRAGGICAAAETRPEVLVSALPIAVQAALIRLGLGHMGRELFLASQEVLPQRAAEQGFRFRFPFLDAALAEIVGGHVRGRARLLNEGLVLRDRRQKRAA